ncbi:hypothetical protein GCM10010912_30990 [Paenibacillus albidus]|uniref:DUF5709 domain-containing protein n=1 Tax=Paenibacillus albidus TaxID=2041023 RepID=A0A917FJI3_9BACL|nr:hypothetical protein [Paenibacillus albidus]GGF83610.1 hypothetical protein GCM10010912_30990 [Paenibacillus albidus]
MANEFNKTEADFVYERYSKMGDTAPERDIPNEIVDNGSDPVLTGDEYLAADIGLDTPEPSLGRRADRAGGVLASPAPKRDELLESDAMFAAGASGLTGGVIDYADDEEDIERVEETALEDVPDADEIEMNTAVDPVSPPIDVMPGTDILNGSHGEE